MKKIIALLMVLALCVTAFASCGVDAGLTSAGEYLYSLYKDGAFAIDIFRLFWF